MTATVFAMEATAESGAGDDWLAGAMVEFGGDIAERVDVPLEGLEFGTEAEEVIS